ncbi:MAG: hypothetical protein K2I22_04290 [Lachnospiraceae bacterium]|nr:hypothetical protein [Lachnospiraceae bacterium]
MLKGLAEIELRDERTGETIYVRHENMLTNGLSIALTPQIGRYTYPTGYQGGSGAPTTDEQKMNYNRSVMDHLLGGVFLFGETLQESAGNLELPLGALIGKGAHNAYSGVDTRRGSYNEAESGLQPDGSFRHVWDFTTAQANGTIRALALTTHAGGIEGDGTREWNSAQTAENADIYTLLTDSGNYGAYVRYTDEMDGSCFLFASYSKNRIYVIKSKHEITYNSSGSYPDMHFSNSGKLHVMEYGFPLSKISPFYDGYNLYRVKEHEIEVPAAFLTDFGTSHPQMYYCVSDSYVYLFAGNVSTKKGKDIKLLRLKKNTLEAEVVSLPNVTGTDLYLSSVAYGATRNIYLTDTHAYLIATEQDEDKTSRTWLYRVSLADGTDAARVELRDYDGNITTSMFVFIGARGRHILMGYNFSSGSVVNLKPMLLDPSVMEIKYLNAKNVSISSNSIFHYEKLTAGLYLNVGSGTRGNFNFIPAIDPCMLMTVNNLSAPVEKTAAQSMKVTYTITET